MAPRDQPSSHLDASQDVDSQDGSQLLDTINLEELKNQHRSNVKTRRRGVEARLRQTQQEGYAELRRQIEVEKAAYEADLKAAQRPHLEDIAGLYERKKQLELEIEKSRDEMERAQNVVSQQLHACIKSRVEASSK